jgi:TonB family protein
MNHIRVRMPGGAPGIDRHHGRSIMRTVILLLFILGFWSPKGLAETDSTQSFRLDFEQARAAIKGDAEGLSYLEGCAVEHYVCAMLAGRSHQGDKRHDAAVGMYRKALELGYPDAAFELQAIEFRRDNFIESFAWGQLAILLRDPNQERARDEIQALPEFMMLAGAFHKMDESERAQAEALTQERIARWETSVRAWAERDILQHLEIRRSVNPRYPRDLAINRIDGYALLYLEFTEKGDVTDVIEMAYSHRLFGREAQRAVKRWNVRAPVDGEPVAGTAVQRVDFMIDPDRAALAH